MRLVAFLLLAACSCAPVHRVQAFATYKDHLLMSTIVDEKVQKMYRCDMSDTSPLQCKEILVQFGP